MGVSLPFGSTHIGNNNARMETYTLRFMLIKSKGAPAKRMFTINRLYLDAFTLNEYLSQLNGTQSVSGKLLSLLPEQARLINNHVKERAGKLVCVKSKTNVGFDVSIDILVARPVIFILATQKAEDPAAVYPKRFEHVLENTTGLLVKLSADGEATLQTQNENIESSTKTSHGSASNAVLPVSSNSRVQSSDQISDQISGALALSRNESSALQPVTLATATGLLAAPASTSEPELMPANVIASSLDNTLAATEWRPESFDDMPGAAKTAYKSHPVLSSSTKMSSDPIFDPASLPLLVEQCSIDDPRHGWHNIVADRDQEAVRKALSIDQHHTENCITDDPCGPRSLFGRMTTSFTNGTSVPPIAQRGGQPGRSAFENRVFPVANELQHDRKASVLLYPSERIVVEHDDSIDPCVDKLKLEACNAADYRMPVNPIPHSDTEVFDQKSRIGLANTSDLDEPDARTSSNDVASDLAIRDPNSLFVSDCEDSETSTLIPDIGAHLEQDSEGIEEPCPGEDESIQAAEHYTENTSSSKWRLPDEFAAIVAEMKRNRRSWMCKICHGDLFLHEAVERKREKCDFCSDVEDTNCGRCQKMMGNEKAGSSMASDHAVQVLGPADQGVSKDEGKHADHSEAAHELKTASKKRRRGGKVARKRKLNAERAADCTAAAPEVLR